MRPAVLSLSGPSPRCFVPAGAPIGFSCETSGLDAIAWLDSASTQGVAQFAGVDPRTAGKLIKNAREIGLVESPDGTRYHLAFPYPYKGSPAQKVSVVREALVRLPLLSNVRQLLSLGNGLSDALRKAATIAGIHPYNPSALMPLIDWSRKLGVLEPGLRAEVLIDQAVQAKTRRHAANAQQRVVFISHSSKDKPFVRQLAADLTANGVQVWLDEQRIRVGESIPEKIAQGLAESDFFVIVISANSASSDWVKREMNTALVTEIERRKVTILPVRIDATPVPEAIKDKKYTDFAVSYNAGLNELLEAVRADEHDGE